MNWLEVFGWAGSALVVISLVVARQTRFRLLNLLGCIIATAYNLILGIWPYMVMNAVIAVVDTYWLHRLRKDARAGHDYRLLAVGPADPYLTHLLAQHREELNRYYPGFDAARADDAYLAVEGDQVAGLVLLHEDGEDTRIDVDFALPAHRDMSLGKFLYTADGLGSAAGERRYLAPTGPSEEYFAALGFHREDERMALTVAA